MNMRQATTTAIACAALLAGATAPAVAAAPADRPYVQTAGQRWPAPPVATKAMSSVDAARLDKAVLKAIDGSYEETPGAWVGIWSPSKGVRVQAYGDAAKAGRKARVADHNSMGSVTKTVTATAVLQQVARGRLKLTDTVAAIDPALARQFPVIADLTVDQLLGMRSGLPDYANEPVGVIRLITADPKRRFTARELIAIGLASNTVQRFSRPCCLSAACR